MSFCRTCPTKETCTKICDELENHFEKQQAKEGYSMRHIRRKETPYDPYLFISDYFIKLKVRKIHKSNLKFA